MQSVDQTTPLLLRQRYEQVADRIAADIRSGRLAPGDRLPSERDLARRLEVGRASVREAIASLQVAGLLETRPGAGSFVAQGADERPLPAADASPSDLLEARALLEPAVARLASGRGRPDAETEALLDAMASAEDDRAAWNDCDRRFHRRIAELTGNPVLVIIQRSVMGAMAEISAALGPIRTDATVKSRVRILKHLRAGDADAPVREMERNLKRVHSLWLAEAGDRTRGPEPTQRGETRW
jgi:DNA-binding FadR family transcriptional regulator